MGGEDELRGDGVGVFEKQLHQLAHQAGVEAAFHLVDEKHLFALNQVEYQGDVVENALGAVAFVNQREIFCCAIVDAAVYGGEFLGLYLPLGVGHKVKVVVEIERAEGLGFGGFGEVGLDELPQVLGYAQFLKLHILEVDALDAGVEVAQQFAEALFQVFVTHGFEHAALLVGRVGEEHLQRVGKPVFHRVEVFGVAHVVAKVAADHLMQEELSLGRGLGEEGEELAFLLFGVEAQQMGEVELTTVGAPVKHGVVRLAGDEVKPFVSDAFGVVAEAVFIAFAAGGDDEDELRVAFAAFGAEAEGAVNDY